MKILVLGADGYLGWPTVMHFAARGHTAAGLDNFVKRQWEMRIGVKPLWAIPSFSERARHWQRIKGTTIGTYAADLTDYDDVVAVLREFRPDAVIHFAEQPSAPFSMLNVATARETQVNNVVGTLNLIWAMRENCPDCHLVKLGTMGEYGTPNIDIEEGFITVNHKGRSDTLPYPKQPGSFYHLSKVHDSHNLIFAAKIWGLRVTDLNQGVVYGVQTEEMSASKLLRTSFHYDATFGTVLNRFCAQAVAGIPLTVYGEGHQTRGFLNIKDTIQCIDLTVKNPPQPGEFRVFNQFTEQFSVLELANLVKGTAAEKGIKVKVESIPNPRTEMERHHYNAVHTRLLDLGLKPHRLSDTLVASMLQEIMEAKAEIDEEVLLPKVNWRVDRTGMVEAEVAAAGGADR